MMTASPHATELETHRAICSLLPVLKDLDRLLEEAVAVWQLRAQSNGLVEQFRGLYITADEAERRLRLEPGVPLFFTQPVRLAPPPEGSSLFRLGEFFSLSAFDLAVVAIALAPEIDLRYQCLYAFLQDDVTRKRPSVDLALNLLCSSSEEKLLRRNAFAADAPLQRHGIMHMFPDPYDPHPSLISHCLKLEERIVRFLLDETGIDPRLTALCDLVPTIGCPSPAVDSFVLPEVPPAAENVLPLVVCLHAASRIVRRQSAAGAAAARGFGLLAVDLSRCAANGPDLQHTMELALLEARLQCAIPYFEGIEQVDQDMFFRVIAKAGKTVVLGTTTGQLAYREEECTVITVDLAPLSLGARRKCWENSLDRYAAWADSGTLDLLASRFRLTPEQIDRAVVESCIRAGFRSASGASDSVQPGNRSWLAREALMSAARAQSSFSVPAVRKIQPKHSWNDLVLPPAVLKQLREFCARVARTERVLTEWGFEEKLSQGKGATALFTGLSGTGKTMAAEVIAGELQLDLCKIDVAGVISKYIGETEKNLDLIFNAAEGANAILFFDEADALFGKRSEVRDSHDRYANIEISYLLQKMEAYEGPTILATNLSQNLDEAFLRRFAFTIRFPFPNEDGRREIWKSIWPATTPLAPDVDFDYLASRFRLSGGNITNAALGAAFLAAEEGEPVSPMHLLRAIEREYQKMGKTVSLEEMAAELQPGAPQ